MWQADPRVAAVRALRAAGIGVAVYGPRGAWAAEGVDTAGEAWGADAAALDAGARVVLSVSRGGGGAEAGHVSSLPPY